ncbi:hypothetical protein Syn7803C97_43 [Synechococcus phage S-MbCM6]|jgi:hypothetical protein|uniref:Uncharacterized protein n=3 Tax=Namakavirus smbcm6 TaxID=2734120 RepID=H8ZME8_9CAUD|nr:hypothetical protein [Synechococcus phage ACG-2014c]AHB80677.1 hypothetical protein S-MbCM25_042 [Synechococcus phage S-MbCM25]AFD02659.1 hypothetical protein [Synechococcus phage ACG-2014c]AIX14436.1 hypothetical protein Syn7803C43_41 [Synechococcus phage ACG-2014c]AIX22596.1 hypothetical protein Syn7803C97_43 [Synechococcus phage ACG-2014c]AIX22810.1 hypothetical protein Syn7803C98_42 [Synechococcus phage ACG-2014c]
MTNLKSAVLDSMQKEILRQAIFMYVSDLQKDFYQDKKIISKEYNARMKSISEIVEVLHLKNCY